MKNASSRLPSAKRWKRIARRGKLIAQRNHSSAKRKPDNARRRPSNEKRRAARRRSTNENDGGKRSIVPKKQKRNAGPSAKHVKEPSVRRTRPQTWLPWPTRRSIGSLTRRTPSLRS